jgi:3-isopropylmalate dehydrogenase
VSRTVVVMPGDGIGRVVIPEALRVLAAAGFEADLVDAEIGWSCWRSAGDPLPGRTIALLTEHKLGFLGAITSKSRVEAEADLPEHLRGTGHPYRSPILSLRQRFGLDVCVRPCVTFPGNPMNFVRRLADGGVDEPALDITVFRQNTEGLYAGVEWIDPPPEVRAALARHPRFAPFLDVPGEDLAIATRIITRAASRRIAKAAFEYAAARGKSSVDVVEKSNVLRETSGLFVEAAKEVAAGYPGIELHAKNIDAVVLEMTRRPERLGVIVASNLFGDILSDAAAGLTGGLGFAASANLGPDVAIFEPTHGSVPGHAGLEPPIANPIAAILAGALLAEHAGDARAAGRIRAAVAAVVSEGRVRTYDMLRSPAGPATPTRAMTDAILARL